MKPNPCRVNNCEEQSINCGYCTKHYDTFIKVPFDGYIKYMSNRRMRTVERYVYHLSWIGIDKLNSIQKVNDLHDLYIYMTQQEGRQTYSFISNYNIVYVALRSYLEFKGQYNLKDFVSKSGLKHKKKSIDKIKHHDMVDVDLFIQFAGKSVARKGNKWIPIDKKEFEADRDKTFIMFLADTGARCGEAVHTKVSFIDFEKNLVKIAEEGKTGERKALMTERLSAQLKFFISKYDLKVYLFNFKPSINKKKMEVWGSYGNNKTDVKLAEDSYWFYRQGQKAAYMLIGIGRALKTLNKLTPHQMRHSLAMFLHKNKHWAIEKVQVVLGHQDIRTTQIYAKTSVEDVQNDYNKDMNR